MDLSDPLPRLMRLRGMVVRAIPSNEAAIGQSAAHGLNESYRRLRDAVAAVAEQLGIPAKQFDTELPSIDPLSTRPSRTPRAVLTLEGEAQTAATLLGQLGGYVEGLIEAVVLEQEISMEQVKAAREAARQPPGFT